MHRFLHGIRQAFLRPVGACFGLLLSQEDGDKADHNLLHEQEKGCLPPLSGEEDQQGESNLADADNDLRAHCVGQNEGPDNGSLLPKQRGDDNAEEDGEDLLPTLCDKQLRQEVEGELLPLISREQEGPLPQQRGDEADKFYPIFNYLDIVGMHDWKQFLFAHMHSSIARLGTASLVHDDSVIDHAKPRVDPKVKKKKTSLLLCLTIYMPFDPSEYGHDGRSHPYPAHHEPYSSYCLSNKSSFPPPNLYSHLPSTSVFTYHVNLSNEDKDAPHEVLQTTISSIHLPFTPLRGRKGYQAHERQFQVKMMARTGSTTKPKIMMQMRLSYITKDMLDPG